MTAAAAGDVYAALEKERERRTKAEETLSSMKMFLFDYFHQLGPDPMTNIDVIVRALGKALHSTVALYNRLESGLLKTWSIDHEPPGYKREDQPDGHICYEMTIKKRDSENMCPVVLGGLERSPWAELDANVRNYDLRSYLAFPVSLEGKVVGSLCVVDVRDRVYNEIEISIIEAFAKAVTLEEERQLAQAKLAEANTALSKKNQEIETIALTDFLTRLPNRRAIRDTFAQTTAAFKRRRCENKREETPAGAMAPDDCFAVVVGDVDRFKQVNDTWGHSCGDQVLVEVAKILSDSLRGQDSVARWGGEEFIMILPQTGLSGGWTIAERIRERIEKSVIEFEGSKFSVTMTFGVSVHDDPDAEIEATIAKADDALYRGKHAGRNQVVAAEE